MKLPLILLLSFLTIPTFSQMHYVGFQVGPSWNSILTDNSDDTDFRVGFAAGANYKYQFTKNHSIGADLIYSRRGYVIKHYDHSPPSDVISERFRLKINYLEMPIKLGVGFGERVHASVQVGVVPAVLLRGTSEITFFDEEGMVESSRTVRVRNSLAQFDFGFLIEPTIAYPWKDCVDLFASAKYQISVNDLASAEQVTSNTWRHHRFGMDFGMKWRFNRADKQS